MPGPDQDASMRAGGVTGAASPQPVVIPPTVGRVVWFFKFTPSGHKGPLAAHVARVNSESSVNLMVIDEIGSPRSETNVRLVQEGGDVGGWDYCTWMPYQKGQAAKTEALEKQAAEFKRLG